MVVTGERFGRVLRKLLPPGRLFTERAGSTLERLLTGLAGELDRVDDVAASLTAEVDPTSTNFFLAAWERVLGLPDECGPAPTTTVERRAAIVGRLLAGGDLSRQTILNVAAALGYEITIEEGTATPFVAGVNACGDSLGLDGGMFAWQVTAPEGTLQLFQTGVSACGDPLGTAADGLLECAILRAAPAHTDVSFRYVEIGDCYLLLLDELGVSIQILRVGETFQVLDDQGLVLEVAAEGGELRVLDESGSELTVTLAGTCS